MLEAFARIAGVRIIIGLVVVGTIAVSGLFFRDYLSGSVTELKVGDCFDLPTSATEKISDVQHHPCNESHTAELIGLFDYPGNSGAPYPAEAAMDNFATSNCVAAFAGYARRDAYTDEELTVGWLIPTPDGWADGDRGISCHLLRVDHGSMTRSYRAA